MFKKILVALDRSLQAASVVDFALSIAQPKVSEVLLLHFIDWQIQDVSPWIGFGTLYDVNLSRAQLIGQDSPLATTSYDRSRQRLQKEVETSQDWLETLTKKAQKRKNLIYQYECRIGNCNLGIGDRAKEWGADLIVIGRRGHRNISEILLGSVSNYVIHHAPCSVMVVQGSKTSSAEELLDAAEI